MTKGTLLSLDETQGAMEVSEVLISDNLGTGWKKLCFWTSNILSKLNQINAYINITALLATVVCDSHFSHKQLPVCVCSSKTQGSALRAKSMKRRLMSPDQLQGLLTWMFNMLIMFKLSSVMYSDYLYFDYNSDFEAKSKLLSFLFFLFLWSINNQKNISFLPEPDSNSSKHLLLKWPRLVENYFISLFICLFLNELTFTVILF